jgi:hypothetical protein
LTQSAGTLRKSDLEGGSTGQFICMDGARAAGSVRCQESAKLLTRRRRNAIVLFE